MKTIVTKLFETYDQAQRAVRDLEDGGVSHNDISIVASNADGKVRIESSDRGKGTGATVGAVAGGAVGLLTGLGLMAIPGVGPVVAAGWLVAAGGGAVVGAGAGGLVGALADHGISKDDAEVYAESLRRGGALVAVRADNDNEEFARAEEILSRHSTIDVEERATAYRASGWRGFDPNSTVPYGPTEEEIRRDRRV